MGEIYSADNSSHPDNAHRKSHDAMDTMSFFEIHKSRPMRQERIFHGVYVEEEQLRGVTSSSVIRPCRRIPVFSCCTK